MPNQTMITSSWRFITRTASTMRSSSFLRQRPLSTCVGMHCNHSWPSFSSGTTNAIARRTVHVEQHQASDNDDTTKTNAKPARNRSRRTRTKRLSLDDRKVPSYKEFVQRFTVITMYRGFLKCIRDGMPHNQDDLRAQVRKEFQLNKHDTDSFTVKQNIAEGKRRYEELMEFTGQSNKYSGESWIKIQDPDDPRGRVGTGWPWAK